MSIRVTSGVGAGGGGDASHEPVAGLKRVDEGRDDRVLQGMRSGEGRSEGLRRVQLETLKRKGRRHPFYWVSFIQSGEWANLEGQR